MLDFLNSVQTPKTFAFSPKKELECFDGTTIPKRVLTYGFLHPSLKIVAKSLFQSPTIPSSQAITTDILDFPRMILPGTDECSCGNQTPWLYLIDPADGSEVPPTNDIYTITSVNKHYHMMIDLVDYHNCADFKETIFMKFLDSKEDKILTYHDTRPCEEVAMNLPDCGDAAADCECTPITDLRGDAYRRCDEYEQNAQGQRVFKKCQVDSLDANPEPLWDDFSIDQVSLSTFNLVDEHDDPNFVDEYFDAAYLAQSKHYNDGASQIDATVFLFYIAQNDDIKICKKTFGFATTKQENAIVSFDVNTAELNADDGILRIPIPTLRADLVTAANCEIRANVYKKNGPYRHDIEAVFATNVTLQADSTWDRQINAKQLLNRLQGHIEQLYIGYEVSCGVDGAAGIYHDMLDEAISFKYNQDTESNACSKRIFCETPNKLKVQCSDLNPMNLVQFSPKGMGDIKLSVESISNESNQVCTAQYRGELADIFVGEPSCATDTCNGALDLSYDFNYCLKEGENGGPTFTCPAFSTLTAGVDPVQQQVTCTYTDPASSTTKDFTCHIGHNAAGATADDYSPICLFDSDPMTNQRRCYISKFSDASAVYTPTPPAVTNNEQKYLQRIECDSNYQDCFNPFLLQYFREMDMPNFTANDLSIFAAMKINDQSEPFIIREKIRNKFEADFSICDSTRTEPPNHPATDDGGTVVQVFNFANGPPVYPPISTSTPPMKVPKPSLPAGSSGHCTYYYGIAKVEPCEMKFLGMRAFPAAASVTELEFEASDVLEFEHEGRIFFTYGALCTFNSKQSFTTFSVGEVVFDNQIPDVRDGSDSAEYSVVEMITYDGQTKSRNQTESYRVPVMLIPRQGAGQIELKLEIEGGVIDNGFTPKFSVEHSLDNILVFTEPEKYTDFELPCHYGNFTAYQYPDFSCTTPAAGTAKTCTFTNTTANPPAAVTFEPCWNELDNSTPTPIDTTLCLVDNKVRSMWTDENNFPYFTNDICDTMNSNLNMLVSNEPPTVNTTNSAANATAVGINTAASTTPSKLSISIKIPSGNVFALHNTDDFESVIIYAFYALKRPTDSTPKYFRHKFQFLVVNWACKQTLPASIAAVDQYIDFFEWPETVLHLGDDLTIYAMPLDATTHKLKVSIKKRENCQSTDFPAIAAVEATYDAEGHPQFASFSYDELRAAIDTSKTGGFTGTFFVQVEAINLSTSAPETEVYLGPTAIEFLNGGNHDVSHGACFEILPRVYQIVGGVTTEIMANDEGRFSIYPSDPALAGGSWSVNPYPYVLDPSTTCVPDIISCQYSSEESLEQAVAYEFLPAGLECFYDYPFDNSTQTVNTTAAPTGVYCTYNQQPVEDAIIETTQGFDIQGNPETQRFVRVFTTDGHTVRHFIWVPTGNGTSTSTFVPPPPAVNLIDQVSGVFTQVDIAAHIATLVGQTGPIAQDVWMHCLVTENTHYKYLRTHAMIEMNLEVPTHCTKSGIDKTFNAANVLLDASNSFIARFETNADGTINNPSKGAQIRFNKAGAQDVTVSVACYNYETCLWEDYPGATAQYTGQVSTQASPAPTTDFDVAALDIFSQLELDKLCHLKYTTLSGFSYSEEILHWEYPSGVPATPSSQAGTMSFEAMFENTSGDTVIAPTAGVANTWEIDLSNHSEESVIKIQATQAAGSTSMIGIVFSTFEDTNNLQKLEGIGTGAFANKCLRVSMANPADTFCDTTAQAAIDGTAECTLNGVDYTGCQVIAALDGTNLLKCSGKPQALQCVVLSPTTLPPRDVPIFTPDTIESDLGVQLIRLIHEDEVERTIIRVYIDELQDLWREAIYEQDKTHIIYANVAYLQGTSDLVVDQFPLSFKFVREPQPVLDDRSLFVLDRFSLTAKFSNQADRCEVGINSQHPYIADGSLVCKLQMALVKPSTGEVLKDANNADLIINSTTQKYEGPCFSNSDILHNIENPLDTHTDVAYELRCRDANTDEVRAKITSREVRVKMPSANTPTTIAPTECLNSPTFTSTVPGNVLFRDSNEVVIDIGTSGGGNTCDQNKCVLFPITDLSVIGAASGSLAFAPVIPWDDIIDSNASGSEFRFFYEGEQYTGVSSFTENYLTLFVSDLEETFIVSNNTNIQQELFHDHLRQHGIHEAIFGLYLSNALEDAYVEGASQYVITKSTIQVPTLVAAGAPDKFPVCYHCMKTSSPQGPIYYRECQDITYTESATSVDLFQDLHDNETDVNLYFPNDLMMPYIELSSFAIQQGYKIIGVGVVAKRQNATAGTPGSTETPLQNLMRMPSVAYNFNATAGSFNSTNANATTGIPYVKVEAVYKTDVFSGAVVTETDPTQVLMDYITFNKFQVKHAYFFDRPESLQMELDLIVKVQKGADVNAVEEYVFDKRLRVQPAYTVTTDGLEDVMVTLHRSNDNEVQYSFDQDGTQTFELFDPMSNYQKQYKLKVDFTNVANSELLLMTVNNKEALSYLCQNSMENPGNHTCPGFPAPHCYVADVNPEACGEVDGVEYCHYYRNGTNSSEFAIFDYIQLSATQQTVGGYDYEYQQCVVARMPMEFNRTIPLQVIGNYLTSPAAGTNFASHMFLLNDIKRYITSGAPIYIHYYYRYQDTTTQEFSYSYSVTQVYFHEMQTQADLVIKHGADADPSNLVVYDQTVDPQPIVDVTYGNGDYFVEAEFGAGSTVEDLTQQKLRGAIIQDLPGDCDNYRIVREFPSVAAESYKYRVGLSLADQVRYISLFGEQRFGFALSLIDDDEVVSNELNGVAAFPIALTKPTTPATDACFTRVVNMVSLVSTEPVIPADPATGVIDIDRYEVKGLSIDLDTSTCATKFYAGQMVVATKAGLDAVVPNEDLLEGAEYRYRFDVGADDGLSKVEVSGFSLSDIHLALASGVTEMEYHYHILLFSADNQVEYISGTFKFKFTDALKTRNLPDRNCDVAEQTTWDFKVYWGTENVQEQAMYGCDSTTEKYGGRQQDYEIDFGEPIVMTMVFNLAQCRVNTRKYIQDTLVTAGDCSNGPKTRDMFDLAALKTEMDGNFPGVYDNLFAKQFALTTMFCEGLADPTVCRVSLVDRRAQISAIQFLRLVSPDEMGVHPPMAQVCEVKADSSLAYHNCQYILLPRLRAPYDDGTAYQDTDFVQWAYQEPAQDLNPQPDPENPSEDTIQVNLGKALKITTNSPAGQCVPTQRQVRTYHSLAEENIIRGITIPEEYPQQPLYERYPMDGDCELVMLGSEQTPANEPSYYEDHLFKRYYDYEEHTISIDGTDQTLLFLYERMASGQYKCYIKADKPRPQESTSFAGCYTNPRGTCEIGASCIACKETALSDPESCVNPEVQAPAYCTGFTGSCQAFQNYIDLSRETIVLDNREFEVKSKYNKLLRSTRLNAAGEYVIRKLSDADQFLSQDNSFQGQTPPVSSELGSIFELCVFDFCDLGNGPVILRDCKRFRNIDDITAPPTQVELIVNVPRFIDFDQDITFSATVSGISNYLLTFEVSSHSTHCYYTENQVVSAFDKFACIPYSREPVHLYVKVEDPQTFAEIASYYQTIRIRSFEAPRASAALKPTLTLTQQDNTITPQGENYFILNIPLTVNVAMDAGEVQQVILRNFEFLSEEGPLRKETISMENDLCEQTPIHESYVNGTATCFDINMRQVQCYESLDDPCGDNRVRYDEVDMHGVHSCFVKEEIYDTATEEAYSTHPLDMQACVYQAGDADSLQNAGCPLTKECMTKFNDQKLVGGLPEMSNACFQLEKHHWPSGTTCYENEYRNPINDRFEIEVMREKRADGSMDLMFDNSMWAESLSETVTTYMTVIAGSGANGVVVRKKLEMTFLTFEEPVLYIPRPEFPGQFGCEPLAFGTDYTKDVTITNVDPALTVADFEVVPLGFDFEELSTSATGAAGQAGTTSAGPTPIGVPQASAGTHTLSYDMLLEKYGKIGLETTCHEEVFGFAVTDGTTYYPAEPVRLNLQMPSASDDEAGCFVPTLVCSQDGIPVPTTSGIEIDALSDVTCTLSYAVDQAACTTCQDGEVIELYLSQGDDLHVAYGGYRDSYAANSIPDYSCEPVRMHVNPSTGDATDMYNTVSASTAVNDGSATEISRRTENYGWCQLKSPVDKHPLDSTDTSQATLDLQACYTPSATTCLGVDIACFDYIKWRDGKATAEPAATLSEEYCQPLIEAIELFKSGFNMCIGNLQPDQVFNFATADPVDAALEQYLRRAFFEIEDPAQKYMYLREAQQGEIPTGSVNLYMHAIYKCPSGSYGYSKSAALPVEFVENVPADQQTGNTLKVKGRLAWGESLNAEKFTTGADRRVEKYKLVLKDTTSDCPLDFKEATVAAGTPSYTLSFTFQELLACYYNDLSIEGIEATVEFQELSTNGDVLHRVERSVEMDLPAESTVETDGACTSFSTAFTYQDDSAITEPNPSQLELQLEDDSKWPLKFTVTVSGGVTPYASVIFSGSSSGLDAIGVNVLDKAQPKMMFCENNECYGADRSEFFEDCEDLTSGGGNTCTVCYDGSNVYAKDTANPHPKDHPQGLYNDCYDPSTIATCPVLAYCLNRDTDINDFITDAFLKAFTLQEIYDAINLGAAFPEFPWQNEILPNLGQTTGDAMFNQLQATYCISLRELVHSVDDAIKLKYCEELHFATVTDPSAGQFAPFARAAAPAGCQNTGTVRQSASVEELILNSLEENFYSSTGIRPAGASYVYHLGSEVQQRLLFNLANLSGAPMGAWLVHFGFDESNPASIQAKTCLQQISINVAQPGVKAMLTPVRYDISNNLYSLTPYYFEAQCLDLDPSSTRTNFEYTITATTNLITPATISKDDQIFELDLSGITATTVVSLDYTCTWTEADGSTGTSSAPTQTFTVIPETIDDTCFYELDQDYVEIFEDEGDSSIVMVLEIDTNPLCEISTADLKFNGVTCTWCDQFTGLVDLYEGFKYFSFSLANVPTNQQLTVSLDLTYAIAGTTKTVNLGFDMYRHQLVHFECQATEFISLNQGLAATIVSSDNSATFTPGCWTVESGTADANIFGCQKAFQLDAATVGVLDEGQLTVKNTFMYGQESTDVECFFYISKEQATAAPPFELSVIYPPNLNPRSVPIAEDINVEAVPTSGDFIAFYNSYSTFTWTLTNKDTNTDITGALETWHGVAALSHGSLTASTRYEVVVTGITTTGKNVVFRQPFKTAGPSTGGDISIRNKDRTKNSLSEYEKAVLEVNNVSGAVGYELIEECVPGEQAVVAYSVKGKFKNVFFRKDHAYYVRPIDQNGEGRLLVVDLVALAAGAKPSDITSITDDFGLLSCYLDEFDEDAFFESKFDTLKDLTSFDNGATFDVDEAAGLLESIGSMVSKKGEFTSAMKNKSGDYLKQTIASALSSTSTVSASQKKKIEEQYLAVALKSSDSDFDDLFVEFERQKIANMFASGTQTFTETVTAEIHTKFEKIEVTKVVSGQTRESSYAAGSLSPCKMVTQNSDIIGLADTLGVSSFSLSGNIKATAADTQQYFESLLNDGSTITPVGSQFEGSSKSSTGLDNNSPFTYSAEFTPSNIPTLLLTSTTTSPVCYRFDSATSAWTTTGVTTVDNGSTVSCQTTLSGAIQVIYVTTTTTTDDGKSSGSNVGLIVGLVIGLIVIAVGVTVLVLLIKKAKNKKRRAEHSPSPMFVEDNVKDYKQNAALNAHQESSADSSSHNIRQRPAARGSAFMPQDSSPAPLNMNDLSATEMRPMAVQDFSVEQPSMVAPMSLGMGGGPVARASYQKVQDAEDATGIDDNLFSTPPPARSHREEENKQGAAAAAAAEEDQAPDTLNMKEPSLPQSSRGAMEPPVMSVQDAPPAEPDAASEAGSGQALTGAVVPPSDNIGQNMASELNVEDI